MESVGPKAVSQEGRMMTEKMINAEKAKQLAKMLIMQRL
jgi:hypothetical protein